MPADEEQHFKQRSSTEVVRRKGSPGKYNPETGKVNIEKLKCDILARIYIAQEKLN